MAELQLLAHLGGEALDVALLTPEDRRAIRSGLSGALSEYYSSPGRLAVYRRKFESAVKQDEEAPSKFATKLEILAEAERPDPDSARPVRCRTSGL